MLIFPLPSTPAHRLSLIEPGPVHTEFEAKMIEDVKKKEYPGTDPDTLHYFKNVYLPSSVDIFETLGQRPDDIARVSCHFYAFLQYVHICCVLNFFFFL